MRQGEACPAAHIGLHAEGVMGRGNEVEHKANQIAYGHCHTGIQPMDEHPIDNILDERGKHTYHAESDDLTQSVLI